MTVENCQDCQILFFSPNFVFWIFDKIIDSPRSSSSDFVTRNIFHLPSDPFILIPKFATLLWYSFWFKHYDSFFFKLLLFDNVQGPLPKERGHQIHHQRSLILQPSPNFQRWRCWWCSCSFHQRLKNKLATNDQKLGPELAKQRLSQWTKPLLQGYG